MIRRARLEGKNACWVPGTDHASIATEAKVVKLLRERGIRKGDISRDEFLQHAFDWKDKYGGIILDQLKRLGASCDWERTRFTMEESLSKAVIKVFVDLYRKGRIYRGKRMTNWDPEAKTVLSNEEVLYQEENARLFHIQYLLADDPTQGIVIATQRPETIMADVAVAVHPEDERYKAWIGKQVLIPLIDKAIPIIADTYVDREFGTGALKITPAHDPNDFEIGKRHGLEVIDILDEDGKLNEAAIILVGEDRFAARKKIKGLLEESGNLVKLEDYRTKIGHSERTDAVVEPRLSLQWFLEMKDLAASALEAVRKGEVKFHPEGMWNMYYQWLREENVRDWCVSRQLWWGQRIPAWYLRYEANGEDQHVFVAETAEEALEQARKATGKSNLSMDDLRQEEDVVDTWFSSWLWPISVFDGFENQEELKYYYPTNLLVTGWDIMFFWVARMIMAGYEYMDAKPFETVYFTGIVRDKLGRKMSKSLGNSPDLLALIDQYGTDAVRFGIMIASPAGNDILFDEAALEQGRNFNNKMWNALKLVKLWESKLDANYENKQNGFALRWFRNRLDEARIEINQMMDQFRLSEALKTLYSLIWDDFCSWYLEWVKPGMEQPMDAHTYQSTIDYFTELMEMLHPFMPFITEEIYQHLENRNKDLCVRQVKTSSAPNPSIILQGRLLQDLISGIRDVRNRQQIKPRESIKLFIQTKDREPYGSISSILYRQVNAEEISFCEEAVAGSYNTVIGKDSFYIVSEQPIDSGSQKESLEKELAHLKGFLLSIEKKLGNEKFMANAKPEVVALEQKKKSDAETKIKVIEESLAIL